jgi:hypothetical protein
MDGFFACPECGSSVEIEGLAPGRQVRCAFCGRLVEVPYLPRVPLRARRRGRFAQGKWVRWACWGVGVVVVFALLVSAIRFARRQYQSVQDGTIGQMLASCQTHEAQGRLDEALVELDTVLDLIRRSGVSVRYSLEQERQHRADLARREAQAALDRLIGDRREPYSLGEWLNLVERSKKDQDLATLRPRIEAEFRRSVALRSTTELEAARRDFESGRATASLQGCDRIAGLLPHLSKESKSEVRRATEELVNRLVETHGVSLEMSKGESIGGSLESYRARLLPILTKGLESRGFLPYRETSPWKSAWRRALYHLRLQVSERREGNYLSTENRLTRIESDLTLTAAQRTVWHTMPTARSTVPVPGLPAYHSSRLALSRARSEEFERLLYNDARGQIEGKFIQALGNMPPCCP